MEVLARSDYYTGEVGLDSGYFVLKINFLKPQNKKIYLTIDKEEYYVVCADFAGLPLGYVFILLMVFCFIVSFQFVSWSNSYYLIIIPLFFWIISRITRLFYKKDVELFMNRYNQMKKQYSKHSDFPG